MRSMKKSSNSCLVKSVFVMAAYMSVIAIALGLIVVLIEPHKVETTRAKLPLVVSTWGNLDFKAAAQKSWDRIQSSPNHRLLALVEGLGECEERQCDTTVGYGGSPDETGEVTLDALLMDGPLKRMGAVADLRDVKSVARVAWAVMNFTEHSFIAGNQATEFAKKMGFQPESLETDQSIRIHKEWVEHKCQPNFWKNVVPNPKTQCGPYKPSLNVRNLKQSRLELEFYNEQSHDTIGMVVIDNDGNVSAGTSTNGARHKIAGRVGDSPIPGAGAYADNEIGGAAATGDGDVMMRFLPSFLAVEMMRTGVKPQKAAEIAVMRIRQYFPKFFGAVIAASVTGEHGAACNGMDTFQYVVGHTTPTVHVETVKCF